LTIDGLFKIGRYSFAPTGSTGSLYYDTTDNEFKGYKESGWDSLGGGAGLWTQTGDDIYYNTGNVGIGTTNPTQLLHLFGADSDVTALFHYSGFLPGGQSCAGCTPDADCTDTCHSRYIPEESLLFLGYYYFGSWCSGWNFSGCVSEDDDAYFFTMKDSVCDAILGAGTGECVARLCDSSAVEKICPSYERNGNSQVTNSDCVEDNVCGSGTCTDCSSHFNFTNAFFSGPSIGDTFWSIGIDDSDEAKFKISNSNILGTNDFLMIDDSGNVIINDSGNVGIGTTMPQTKLDVAGAIKIGTQTTCDADSAGAIRYDSTAKKFYGCTGTSWLSIEQQSCGYAVTFNYKGSTVTYETIYNPATGRCWLDRNLGASQVATAFNDANAYGDLFQWGREADGHQVRSPAPSIVEGDMSLTSQPGHANFITEQTDPYDWALNSWTTRWLDAGGVKTAADSCPTGWRLPTRQEWVDEYESWPQQNYDGAYASLKLTAPGYRSRYNAPTIEDTGTAGYYWSASICWETNSFWLDIEEHGVYPTCGYRVAGLSVRCIKD